MRLPSRLHVSGLLGLLGFLSIATQCAANDRLHPRASLERLIKGSLCEKKQAVYSLHRLGKKAVPYLIMGIKSPRPVGHDLMDPRSSSAPRSLDPPSGFLAAYVIELILAKPELAHEDSDNNDGNYCLAILGDGRNYIYTVGAIVKEKTPIDAEELSTVARIYADWWRLNKQKPLAELREAWKKGRGPLAGSPYSWQ